MAIQPGDIVIGGVKGFYEVIHADGSFAEMVQVRDDLGNPSQLFITGAAVRPSTGHVFTTSTPDLLQDNTPHDVDWIPDDSGLLIAVVPTTGVLEFRKVDFAGTVIGGPWTPAVESGWLKESVKISVACNSTTVFYTQSMKRVQRFDLATGTQLTDYRTLDPSSPYIYGGLRVLPLQPGETAPDDYDVVVAMTASGNGPQRAVCLAPDRTSFWVDEVGVAVGGTYHVQKRLLTLGTLLQSVTTRADNATPTPHNDRTLALASYYNPCAVLRVAVEGERTWISNLA